MSLRSFLSFLDHLRDVATVRPILSPRPSLSLGYSSGVAPPWTLFRGFCRAPAVLPSVSLLRTPSRVGYPRYHLRGYRRLFSCPSLSFVYSSRVGHAWDLLRDHRQAHSILPYVSLSRYIPPELDLPGTSFVTAAAPLLYAGAPVRPFLSDIPPESDMPGTSCVTAVDHLLSSLPHDFLVSRTVIARLIIYGSLPVWVTQIYLLSWQPHRQKPTGPLPPSPARAVARPRLRLGKSGA